MVQTNKRKKNGKPIVDLFIEFKLVVEVLIW